jgi:hypothetical protein
VTTDKRTQDVRGELGNIRHQHNIVTEILPRTFWKNSRELNSALGIQDNGKKIPRRTDGESEGMFIIPSGNSSVATNHWKCLSNLSKSNIRTLPTCLDR